MVNRSAGAACEHEPPAQVSLCSSPSPSRPQNDASSLVLFELFLTTTRALAGGTPASSPLAVLPGMARDIVRLAAGGAVVGLALGWLTLQLLRLLRRTNCSMAQVRGCALDRKSRARLGFTPAVGVVGWHATTPTTPPLHADSHNCHTHTARRRWA